MTIYLHFWKGQLFTCSFKYHPAQHVNIFKRKRHIKSALNHLYSVSLTELSEGYIKKGMISFWETPMDPLSSWINSFITQGQSNVRPIFLGSSIEIKNRSFVVRRFFTNPLFWVLCGLFPSLIGDAFPCCSVNSSNSDCKGRRQHDIIVSVLRYWVGDCLLCLKRRRQLDLSVCPVFARIPCLAQSQWDRKEGWLRSRRTVKQIAFKQIASHFGGIKYGVLLNVKAENQCIS